MMNLTHFTFDGDHDAGGKVKLTVPSFVTSYACFSPCRQYRYELHRRWRHHEVPKTVMFIMMNPSTATEDIDDPTVKKCRGYAEQWGYNDLIVTNIMAYRATHPKALLTVDDPVGPENLRRIRTLIEMQRPLVICAWGRPPAKLRYAETQVKALLTDCNPHVLRLNTTGGPWHPLYLPSSLRPMRWSDIAIAE